jgi:lysophospholipase L1-like esterase
MTKVGLRSRSGWMARSLAVIAVMIMIGMWVAGTAQARSAEGTGGASARLPASLSASSEMASSKECFYTYPSCSSSDPSVKYGNHSDGDTSACTFQETVDWGDKSSTTMTFPGGPDGSTLVTFNHTYTDEPHLYTLTVTATTTSGDCGNFSSATLYFTLTGTGPATQKIHMAALGDSYSAGNGTPRATGECDMSPQAWPELVPGKVGGNAISSSVTLLACSGADSTGSGSGDLSAQIAELPKYAPNLVTITIGGDDGRSEGVGFRNVLVACAVGGAEGCAHAIATETSWIEEREPALLRQDFSKIKTADPSAILLAVGYPDIFPDTACAPYDKEIEQVLNHLTASLDTAIGNAAAAVAGVDYVPAISAFGGHELCSGDPWVVRPLTVNAHTGIHDWLHPNKGGQNAIADVVAAFIKDRDLATT